jgi:hypothetical protein
VRGVGLYVERTTALAGADHVARIENLIAALEETNAASARAARARYARVRERLAGDPGPAAA